jgi:hypothetical protein
MIAISQGRKDVSRCAPINAEWAEKSPKPKIVEDDYIIMQAYIFS